MKTNQLRFLIIVFTVIMLLSTFSFATDDTTNPISNDNTIDSTTTTPDNNTQDNNQEPITTKTHDGDLYLFGDKIVMDQLVDGNVYIFGNEVKITGKVNGNLFIFANKLYIEKGSYAINSIYAFANDFNMYGAATDLYLFANNVNINYDAFAKRDMHISAQNLTFQGAVGRDLSVYTENFNLIDGEQGAKIYGNLNYQTTEEIDFPEGVIEGEINFKKITPSDSDKLSTSEIIFKYVYNLVETLIFTALAYLFIKWITPKFAKETGEFISAKKTILAWLIGIAGIIGISLVSLLLIFSYILIPVSIAVLTVLVLLCCLSTTIMVMAIVQKINNKLGNKKSTLKTILIFLVATIVIWALQQLPMVGWIISIFIILPFGFGIPAYYIISRKKDNTIVTK